MRPDRDFGDAGQKSALTDVVAALELAVLVRPPISYRVSTAIGRAAASGTAARAPSAQWAR
jgi:hypothetical protein